MNLQQIASLLEWDHTRSRVNSTIMSDTFLFTACHPDKLTQKRIIGCVQRKNGYKRIGIHVNGIEMI